MEWLVVIAVLLVVLAVLAVTLKSRGQRGDNYPYIRNRVLFSPAERSFLGVLQQAVGDEYRVFGKVRVADVVSVKSPVSRSAWQRAFNRISAKHFDFVLCSEGDLAIVAVVELDDKSHQQRQRQARDSFLAALCQAISLPLIQVPAQRGYSVQELCVQVLSALGATRQAAPENPAPPADGLEAQAGQVEAGHPVAENKVSEQPAASAAGVVCPKCSSAMVRRRAKAGANAGQEFWGCSTFPKCRTILPVSD